MVTHACPPPCWASVYHRSFWSRFCYRCLASGLVGYRYRGGAAVPAIKFCPPLPSAPPTPPTSPVSVAAACWRCCRKIIFAPRGPKAFPPRSEEHTSELQSRGHLVCRLL